ncbi:transformer-SR ribonucleoprotein [Histoplasma capsulatum]|uniref:Transformer-SR ribonucleoprotein n=1 Tax=Ajellomyces capsulatus TaxID=5037 RepID=A0A8A1M6X6_AJECA|nr:predicted protein [Histoplasma mississippiense (nom. inval.)]EDN08154.1 predicted protein [Histoplasma mississippiense (nom. inval.)]QSS61721.1 transformer-SR ribonucleoprotein [Histoplasma capsulatum]
MATMEYETENGRFDGEPRFDRERSASPRGNARRGARNRSMSPNGRGDHLRVPQNDRLVKISDDDEGSVNTGSNLFVTGIHPRLTESDVSRLFEKYGDVESCSIMVDPHTKESRGFGFVKMVTAEQADAAKEGLQGEVIEGRTLSIEKARRGRPRTPTPGKYFGPPKRGTSYARGPPRGGRYDRYDDRRGGYGGGGGRRSDDNYRYGRYDSYNERSRDYGRRDFRDDQSYRGIDRYATSGGREGGREERYERRGGGDDRRGDDRRGYYDRDDARSHHSSAYPDAPPPPRESRDPYGGRGYEGRGGDDRYGAR